MKKAFMTYLFGGYDDLLDPPIVSKSWDYICVSDAPIIANSWKLRPAPQSVIDATSCPKRRSSITKIFHYEALGEDYDLVICADACLDICCDLDAFVDEFFPPDADLVVARHWGRNCLYDEAAAVIELNFDDPAMVYALTQQYAAEGFPRNYGMYACRLLIKNNRSSRLREFLRIWLVSYMAGSRRDQLSMTYALWKFEQETGQQLKVYSFDFDEVFRRRNLFAIRPHILPREWSQDLIS